MARASNTCLATLFLGTSSEIETAVLFPPNSFYNPLSDNLDVYDVAISKKKCIACTLVKRREGFIEDLFPVSFGQPACNVDLDKRRRTWRTKKNLTNSALPVEYLPASCSESQDKILGLKAGHPGQ